MQTVKGLCIKKNSLDLIKFKSCLILLRSQYQPATCFYTRHPNTPLVSVKTCLFNYANSSAIHDLWKNDNDLNKGLQ